MKYYIFIIQFSEETTARKEYAINCFKLKGQKNAPILWISLHKNAKIFNLLPDSSITSSLIADDLRPTVISEFKIEAVCCCLGARFGPSSS